VLRQTGPHKVVRDVDARTAGAARISGTPSCPPGTGPRSGSSPGRTCRAPPPPPASAPRAPRRS